LRFLSPSEDNDFIDGKVAVMQPAPALSSAIVKKLEAEKADAACGAHEDCPLTTCPTP